MGHSKKKYSFIIVSCEWSTFYSIFVIVLFICACMHNYLPRIGCSRFPFASKFPWLWVSTSTGLAFCVCMPSSTKLANVINNFITCQQNDYLSINGHQKTKETSKLKEIVNFKKGIGIERYTQFITVTLIYEKVSKQDEHVNLLCIYEITS